jgi:hypothetical protein
MRPDAFFVRVVTMIRPVHIEIFYGDGRGPDLRRICWSDRGRLEAIEFTPNDYALKDDLHHVRFTGLQVVMITPEEVINYTKMNPYLAKHRPAMMFDLEKSEWLRAFSPMHLAKCRHYQLLFYDELVDVIAEGVVFGKGPFQRSTGSHAA